MSYLLPTYWLEQCCAALSLLPWDRRIPIAEGIVLLTKDPSAVFPHYRVLADAYWGSEPDGEPRDHENIRGPMPLVIEYSAAFATDIFSNSLILDLIGTIAYVFSFPVKL